MIRYPGSKDKIVRAIMARFPDALRLGGLFGREHIEYREPFFGSGAIGFRVMEHLSSSSSIWINDKDYGLRCLWGAVYGDPGQLIECVRSFSPSTEAFYRFRDEDDRGDIDPVEAGFRKLVLHQTSFSGLGVRAGGPIGGRKQSSAYNVDCRWNAPRLCKDITEKHRLMHRFSAVRITALDFEEMIVDAPKHSFIYADPPYLIKGPQLYKHSMTIDDHKRLANCIRECATGWVVSYDDHPDIRALYSWAQISTVRLTYTTAVASENRRKNEEIIISKLRSAA